MKKLINILALPLLAGTGAYVTLSAILPHTNICLESQLQTSQICALWSLLAGFLPCLLVMYAHSVLAGLKPQNTPEIEAQIETLCAPLPELHIGQIFSSNTCKLRVKSLRTSIFAGANFDQFEYALNFSL